MPYVRKNNYLASKYANKWRTKALKEKAKNALAKNPSIAPAMATILRSGRKRLTMGSRIPTVYTFKQLIGPDRLPTAGIASSDIAPQLGAMHFQLSYLPQVATFSALFDEYRIVAIRLMIRARASVHQLIGNGQGTVPQPYAGLLYIAVDHDDSVAPASVNELREYGNARSYNLVHGKDIYIDFVPSVSSEIYNSVVSTGYSERKSPWIDMLNPSIPHFGVKWALGTTQANYQYTVDFEAKYLVQFRGVR